MIVGIVVILMIQIAIEPVLSNNVERFVID
jgi:hypothetical protein